MSAARSFNDLNQSPIGIIVLDINFNIIFSNNVINEAIPFRNSNITNLVDMLDQECQKKLEEFLLNNQFSKESFTLSVIKYNKIFLLYKSDLFEEDKRYFICKLFDIRHYKETEDRLAHAEKMQSLGQLSGAIAHDFNNLLTGMIGFCDILLLRHKNDPESFENLTQIKQNADRAANLIKQLLAFSRKQILEPQILDVRQIINDLSTLIQKLLGPDISLSIKHFDDQIFVKADKSQLEQVIVNLSVNARDAIGLKGSVCIRTSHILVDDTFLESNYHKSHQDKIIEPGKYVVIEIQDSGSGIPLKIVDKIFEPFFSTKDITAGTGLGLSTVHNIIDEAGGHIRIKTNNHGTTFCIFLKNTPKILSDKNYIDQQNPQELEIVSNNDKIKILFVEDEPSIRLFAVHTIKKKGYEALETNNASEALNILSKFGNEINLIITDIMMPGMSGTEMAEIVTNLYPHIKFLFTSGYAEDSISYLNSRNHHFLSKPFSIKELEHKIDNVLKTNHK